SYYPEGGVLKVQGVETPYTPLASDPDRSWSADVVVDPAHEVTEVTAIYNARGIEYRQILSVIDHEAVVDQTGTYVEDGVGMRFTNAGLAGLGPIIQDLASGSFDLNAMLVGQQVNTSD